MIDTREIHPSRYMRSRPFAKSMVRHYMRTAGTEWLTPETLAPLIGAFTGVFNEAISGVPVSQRPEPGRVGALINQEFSYSTTFSRWFLNGRRIYRLLPGLAERIHGMQTDGLALQDLIVPHPIIYLAFGAQEGLRLSAGDFRIDGAYVQQLPNGFLEFRCSAAGPRRADESDWLNNPDPYFHYSLRPEKGEGRTTIAAALRSGRREIKVDQLKGGYGTLAALTRLIVSELYELKTNADRAIELLPAETPGELRRQLRESNKDRVRGDIINRLANEGIYTIRVLGDVDELADLRADE